MRFRLPQKDFLRLFAIAKETALDEKCPVPIMSKVRIDASRDGSILFEGHSIDATMTVATRGDVLSPGSIAAPRMLDPRLRHMPEGMLEIDTTEGAMIDLSHTSEKRRFRVFGIPASDWPTTNKKPEGDEQRVPVAALRLLIESVEACVSTDTTKEGLNSLMIHWQGSQLRAVGIDGHRCTFHRLTASVYGTYDLLIRKNHLRAIKALLDMATAAEIADIRVIPGADKLALMVGDATYVCRLTGGAFPPWASAVPGAWIRRFKLPRVKLLDAIKGATLVDSAMIRLQFKGDGKVYISSNSAENGDVEDFVEPADVIVDKGVSPDFKVTLSPRYLREAVEALTGEDVFLCPTDFGGVVMVAPGEEQPSLPIESSHLAVIMPMKG